MSNNTVSEYATGKRYSPEVVNRALMMLAAGEKPRHVADTLKVPYTTVMGWKKGNPTRLPALKKRLEEATIRKMEKKEAKAIVEQKFERKAYASNLADKTLKKISEAIDYTRDLDKLIRALEALVRLADNDEENTGTNFSKLKDELQGISQKIEAKSRKIYVEDIEPIE